MSDSFLPRTPHARPLTEEQQLEAAKAYTTQVIHEIEKALIGEIEKIEGKVPTPDEMQKHGRCLIDKRTMANTYYWRDKLIVTARPGVQKNGSRQRGTMIEVHKQPPGGAGGVRPRRRVE